MVFVAFSQIQTAVKERFKKLPHFFFGNFHKAGGGVPRKTADFHKKAEMGHPTVM